MMKRRENSTYVLTVEGQCEQYYFEHLQKLINSNDKRKKQCVYKPAIVVSTNPLGYSKRYRSLENDFYHIQDIEDYNNLEQKNKFDSLLKDLEEARKNVNYKLGYSNYSFNLWICLHKKDMIYSKSHRKEYIKDINESYGTNYEFIDQYKNENNFKCYYNRLH